jgi:uncharacterized oligopeptide transporter (OPT) family protein
MGMGSSIKPPQMLRLAAAIQTVEAVGVFVAAILALVDTLSGQSYSKASGVGLAVLTVITAALVGSIARGVAQVRPWSRTPAVMTQITIGIVAIVLLQGGRYDWGIPGLVLAVVALAALLTPASLRALVRD